MTHARALLTGLGASTAMLAAAASALAVAGAIVAFHAGASSPGWEWSRPVVVSEPQPYVATSLGRVARGVRAATASGRAASRAPAAATPLGSAVDTIRGSSALNGSGPGTDVPPPARVTGPRHSLNYGSSIRNPPRVPPRPAIGLERQPVPVPGAPDTPSNDPSRTRGGGGAGGAVGSLITETTGRVGAVLGSPGSSNAGLAGAVTRAGANVGGLVAGVGAPAGGVVAGVTANAGGLVTGVTAEAGGLVAGVGDAVTRLGANVGGLVAGAGALLDGQP